MDDGAPAEEADETEDERETLDESEIIDSGEEALHTELAREERRVTGARGDDPIDAGHRSADWAAAEADAWAIANAIDELRDGTWETTLAAGVMSPVG